MFSGRDVLWIVSAEWTQKQYGSVATKILESVHGFIYLSIRLFIYLLIYLPIYLFTFSLISLTLRFCVFF